uniref:SpdA-like protein n=1 Tax=Streptomyces sp. x4(2010) TaxID=706422 RepID=D3JSU6_9ACTN|nr:SpdA-like protein [Streptomyces sp. x4(2010)]
MDVETPRGPDGERLCAWCGKGPVPPSRGTKPRAYCSRACVHRAYRARKAREQRERLVAAYMKGRAEEAEAWRSGAKSRDLLSHRGKSRAVMSARTAAASSSPWSTICGGARRDPARR